MERVLNDQELVRRQKADELREKGIDPYGQAYIRSHTTDLIRKDYEEKTREELEALEVKVNVAGRIMAKRRMGKLGFIKLQDKNGHIQIVVNKQEVGEEIYELFKASDLGDIIGIEGNLMKTNTDELSIRAKTYTHLSKALRPLPEKFHGLQDVEERYRRRYLDLITNENSRKIAMLRPRIIRAVQHFLDSMGLIEVETPVLQPILGGASARPFITHHNTLNVDLYLRIATELPLKRLIVGGLEGVYEIGRLFRNEGMDTKHNPEFTTVEAYVAYSDMYGMMELCENLFKSVAQEAIGKLEFEWNGKTISLNEPFKRVHMVDAIKEETGIDFFEEMDVNRALELAKEHKIPVEKHEETVGHIINLFFETYCEDKLIQPTFVYGHPIEISPLAKKSKDERFTDRFELFIDKTEYANAFSELNDPIDQRERFENQLKQRELGNDEANEMDVDYVEALEYGMPPTGGIGIGIDRLVMFLTGSESIREVLLFPTMKNIGSNTKKEVKPERVNIDLSKVEIEPLFKDEVDFETFSKSDIRAVKVKSCEAVAKSKKLLKFVLDDGSGSDRVILSGIHSYYEPEELVGKTLLAILNLPPRSMMGIDSCGMILSAIHEDEKEERLNLIMVDDAIPAGAKIY